MPDAGNPLLTAAKLVYFEPALMPGDCRRSIFINGTIPLLPTNLWDWASKDQMLNASLAVTYLFFVSDS